MSLSRRSKDDVFSYVPAGTVLSFAGDTPPSGWAICDGTIISRSDYAQLYMAIGDAWGNGDGSTTFHLPDLRGRFMRGSDNTAGRDPNAGSRNAANAGGNTGDNVGSVQGDGTNTSGVTASTSSSAGGIDTNHTHGTHTYNNTNQPGSAANVSGIRYTASSGNNTTNPSASHSHAITSNTTVGGGAAESRPINANVNYIIKL